MENESIDKKATLVKREKLLELQNETQHLAEVLWSVLQDDVARSVEQGATWQAAKMGVFPILFDALDSLAKQDHLLSRILELNADSIEEYAGALQKSCPKVLENAQNFIAVLLHEAAAIAMLEQHIAALKKQLVEEFNLPITTH
jgi:hypothetical protein